MTLRDRLFGPWRRIRRWLAARWHQLGLRLFPRVHDRILDNPPSNVFVIIHRQGGLDEEIFRSQLFGESITEWAAVKYSPSAYPGEVQYWKNGKLRDTRPAVTP